MFDRSVAKTAQAWLLLAFVGATAVNAQVRECGPDLYRRMATAIDGNAATQALALDWAQRYRSADAVVARGMMKAAIQKDVKALVEGFRDLPVGANPFPNEQAIYKAVGELTNDRYEGVPGLNNIVGNLFSDSAPNEKGAIFTLWIGERRGLKDMASLDPKAGFEQNVASNGGSRRYDARETDALAPADIGGIVHENKNWTTPLSGPNDGRLVDFADREFVEDILIHAGSNWQFYRINLRTAVVGQSDLIRDRLLLAFDNPRVQALGEATVERVKTRFEQLWNAGAQEEFVRFY